MGRPWTRSGRPWSMSRPTAARQRVGRHSARRTTRSSRRERSQPLNDRRLPGPPGYEDQGRRAGVDVVRGRWWWVSLKCHPRRHRRGTDDPDRGYRPVRAVGRRSDQEHRPTIRGIASFVRAARCSTIDASWTSDPSEVDSMRVPDVRATILVATAVMLLGACTSASPPGGSDAPRAALAAPPPAAPAATRPGTRALPPRPTEKIRPRMHVGSSPSRRYPAGHRDRRRPGGTPEQRQPVRLRMGEYQSDSQSVALTVSTYDDSLWQAVAAARHPARRSPASATRPSRAGPSRAT